MQSKAHYICAQCACTTFVLSCRYRAIMATPHFNASHWRKSSQWFVLTRPHAALAIADDHVQEIFRRYCYSNHTHGLPLCVSDEHFLPSLLASYGLDDETDCQGLGHYADWSLGGWHPRSLTAADVASGRLPTLLQSSGAAGWRCGQSRRKGADSSCDAHAAIISAISQFHVAPVSNSVDASSNVTLKHTAATAKGLATNSRSADNSIGSSRRMHTGRIAAHVQNDAASKAGQHGYQRLGYDCALFARKFPESVVNRTLAMALSCGGLGLDSWCTELWPF